MLGWSRAATPPGWFQYLTPARDHFRKIDADLSVHANLSLSRSETILSTGQNPAP
jgi:hypothetical protein